MADLSTFRDLAKMRFYGRLNIRHAHAANAKRRSLKRQLEEAVKNQNESLIEHLEGELRRMNARKSVREPLTQEELDDVKDNAEQRKARLSRSLSKPLDFSVLK